MYYNNGIYRRGIMHFQIHTPHQYDGSEPNQNLNVFCKGIESRHFRLVTN